MKSGRAWRALRLATGGLLATCGVAAIAGALLFAHGEVSREPEPVAFGELPHPNPTFAVDCAEAFASQRGELFRLETKGLRAFPHVLPDHVLLIEEGPPGSRWLLPPLPRGEMYDQGASWTEEGGKRYLRWYSSLPALVVTLERSQDGDWLGRAIAGTCAGPMFLDKVQTPYGAHRIEVESEPPPMPYVRLVPLGTWPPTE